MIAERLVDQAKDDLDVLSLLFAVVAGVIAIFGPALLDEGHRVRRNGFLAIALAMIGLALTGGQLILMAGLMWSSLTSHGSFQPLLFIADVYFVVMIVIFVTLLWVLTKAVKYTRQAED